MAAHPKEPRATCRFCRRDILDGETAVRYPEEWAHTTCLELDARERRKKALPYPCPQCRETGIAEDKSRPLHGGRAVCVHGYEDANDDGTRGGCSTCGSWHSRPPGDYRVRYATGTCSLCKGEKRLAVAPVEVTQHVGWKRGDEP